jgi:hypothetical protein
MLQRRSPVIVLALLALGATDLTGQELPPRTQCSLDPPRSAARFAPAKVLTLQGTFRLRLVRIENNHDVGGLEGILTLQAHDSAHRYRYRRLGAGPTAPEFPLWGWMDSVSGAPGWGARVTSRDPDSPGLEWRFQNLVFGDRDMWDGVTTSLTVTHVAPTGFWGRWQTMGGFDVIVDSLGHEVPEVPSVRYFCAIRLH